MKLINCYVENFGTLSEYSHDFSDGVNCILENNSWGKSTLAAFIKAMLYGLSATRAADLLKNERKKYTPWCNGSFGGYICIEHEGKKYRIERVFCKNAKDDTLKVTELESGKETDILGDIPGQTLLGVNSSAFERSVYVAKESPKDEKDEGLKSIVAKLNGIVDKSDIENYNSAIKKLDDKRKLYAVTKGGLIGEQNSILLDLQSELEECRSELKELENVNEQIDGAEGELHEISLLRIKFTNELNRIRDRAIFDEKRENYKKMLVKESAFKQKIRQIEIELGEFSDNDSLISELEGDIKKYERCDSIIADSQKPLNISKRETAELFSKYLPDIALIETLEIKKAELESKKKSNELLLTNDEEQTLERLFKMSFPTDSEKSEYEKRALRIEVLQEERAKCKREINNTSVSVFDNKSMAFVLIFSLLCVTGVMLAVFWNVIVGVVSALLGAILLVWTFAKSLKVQRYGADVRNKQLAKIDKSIADLEDLRREFAEKYGISVHDSSALKYLDSRQEQLKRLSEKKEKSREAFESFKKESWDWEQNLKDIYEKMGHPELIHGDFSSFCLKVRAFTEGREEYLSEKTCLEGAISEKKELRNKLNGFFAAVGITQYSSYEAALQMLREKFSELSRIKKNLSDIVHEREIYLADNPGCQSDQENIDQTNGYDPQQELATLGDREQVIIAEKAALEIKRAKIDEKVQKIPEIEEKIENHRQTLNEYKYRLSIVERTKDVLSTAKDNLSKRYHGAMKERFESWLSELSGSKTIIGHPDTDLNVHIESHGIMREIGFFSTGIRELVFVALHVALADVLFNDEECFIIFDDPFVSLDGEHLEQAKKTLKKLGKSRQIIYFTCHESRVLTGGYENE